MNRIKIGQIGIGHDHASGRMVALRRLSDFYEVVGVVEEKDAEWAETHRARKAYEGLKWMTEEELLNTPGLQAVAVETNIPDLASTATRCMERGLHMHYDKPGGETLEPFKRLLDGCEAQKLAIQLGYMYRNNPAIKLCFRAVREGWLGDIFEVHAVMSHCYGGEPYRRYMAKFRGGSMFIFGCHLIDLVITILGRPEKVAPFLKATRGDDVNDNGLAVLEYPRATATIRTCAAEVDGMKHRRLIVCGTKGTVEICPLEYPPDRYRLDPLHMRMTLLEDNPEYPAGTHIVNAGVMNDRYDDQLIELARIISGEIENPYPYKHELLVQETLLAAAGYTNWR